MSETASPPGKNDTSEPDHKGHRQRLRERFRKNGEDSLADYELLEFLLFSALPRQDTKPIAKALLQRFGSFSAALAAPRSQLKEIRGLSEISVDTLKAVYAAVTRFHKAELKERKMLDSWNKVLTYLQASMQHSEVEQFRILFLDKKNRLIADEVQQTGTVDHTPVYPREIIKRALELSATALILVHNHPSGDPTPSRADIQMTQQIIDVAKPLGIEIHDHIIVGLKTNVSFRSLQLI